MASGLETALAQPCATIAIAIVEVFDIIVCIVVVVFVAVAVAVAFDDWAIAICTSLQLRGSTSLN